MSNPLTSPLFDADTLKFLQQVFKWVRSGVVVSLAPMWAAGLPLKLRNEQGDSLLILPAYHGLPALAHLLLDTGADSDMVNDRGQIALGAAAFKGDVQVAQQLLDHSALADSPPGGRTALMIAAMFNGLDTMALLRQRGADPWAHDPGDSPPCGPLKNWCAGGNAAAQGLDSGLSPRGLALCKQLKKQPPQPLVGCIAMKTRMPKGVDGGLGQRGRVGGGVKPKGLGHALGQAFWDGGHELAGLQNVANGHKVRHRQPHVTRNAKGLQQLVYLVVACA